VKKDCTIRPGDIVAAYPGSPSWKTPAQVSDMIKKKRNPYVFSIGPFVLRNSNNREFLLCWDGASVGFECETNHCGHLLNTSHPRLHAPWNQENCIFALYLNDLKLTYRGDPPVVKLFIMSTKTILGGPDPNPLYELRLDYHYLLASEFGFWCLELGCVQCVDNLLEFVDTYMRR
jgi:hypothetical protein